VLVVEFSLTAAAGLAAYPPGRERFTQLTGLAPRPVVYRGLGLLSLLSVAGLIAGFWWPPLAIGAAAYLALLSGFTLVRQLQREQRGRDLFAYGLFLVCALVVIAVHVLR